MGNFFTGIYSFFKKNQLAFYLLTAACFITAGHFASRVRFEEDISKILPKDKKIEKLNQVFQNSKFLDKLVVMISLKDSSLSSPDSLVNYADSFVVQAEDRLKNFTSRIDGRVDENVMMGLMNTVVDRLPIYLQESDYAQIDSLIEPRTLRSTLAQDILTLSSPTGIAFKKVISADPVGISFIALRKMQQLQYDENFSLHDGYVITGDKKTVLLFLTPKYPPGNTKENQRFIRALDELIVQLPGASNFDTRYFGATAVSLGNALQLRTDTLLTQGVIVIFLLVFLGLYFRKKRAPLLILVPVLFGALFSLAIIYFIKGSISVIALGTGAVVLGIAVNYSLHVYNHYLHTQNMKTVLHDLSIPLTVGSFTTIGGFLCMQFLESEMLKDLGLFAAFSLIGASLASLLILPQLLGNKLNASGTVRESRFGIIDKLSKRRPERNKILVASIFILTIFFAYKARTVGFESDLLGMNYMSPELRKSEQKLNEINAYAMKSVYLVAEGNDLEQALVNNEKLSARVDELKSKGIISKYSGVSSLVISDSLQRKRIYAWNNYWTPEKKAALLRNLEEEGKSLGFSTTAFQRFSTLLAKDYQPGGANEMQEIRKSFLGDYITEKAGHSSVVTMVKINAQNAPTLYKTFEADASVTVVDRQYLTNKFIEIINADFGSIALMTSLLVFTVLLIMYGRIELTLISFIPMLISWIWILGLMSLFNIQFNIINIIISALIFGLGDDYSLFIMDGLLKEYKTGRKNLASYKTSIFLSAITTIAGLGVLIFAKHPALRSIAGISIIGIICVVIMSQVLIPFFFSLLIKNRTAKKKFPWTLAGLFISAFAFCYFIVGCILLMLIGLIFKISPFGTRRTKYAYHVIMRAFAWSMMYIMGNVKKVVINPLKETFSKPAVIISNHQSFLDILSMLMLSPKMILFTNNWVWNSPFFGLVVRMADFYPISQGAELSINLLEQKVREGYSIMIFPEGTRSVDGVMKRFHKGAFYLAEQLNIDILPIVLHGTGYTMSKNDFLLKNGRITVKFLPRITPKDQTYGDGYVERTKLVGKYFRTELELLTRQIEQPAYFREQLKYNYIYKGPTLEWYMRIKTRLENYYKIFDELVPRKGRILDIGCGNGFLCYMLSFASPSRNILGIDYDEEKIDTANNCFSKNSNINFEVQNVAEYAMGNYDAIIMADILHYLQPQQQETVIENCIRHLNPGGAIVIREGNVDLEERHKGTTLTEFFSTRFTGFNKTTEAGLSFLSGTKLREIAKKNNMSCNEIDNTRYTSNIIFVIKYQDKIQHEG